jgi:hypothetical protein
MTDEGANVNERKTNRMTELCIWKIRSFRSEGGSRFSDPDYGMRAKYFENEKGRKIWAISNLRNCSLLSHVRVLFWVKRRYTYVQMSKFDTVFFQ